MAAPVVLEMDVHCRRCAKKIRRSLTNIFGADRVSASPQMGMVVVHGDVHAYMLRWWLQRAMRRPVAVLSDGGRPRPHFEAPPPPSYAWAHYPYAYPCPYHWSTPPPDYPYGQYDGNACSIL